MKVRSPYDRHDLMIKKNDRVVEVGPGHYPTLRANVIVEKFVDTNYHRCGDVKIYPHQTFYNAPGEALPFKDNEFDYIICNQVLEHADDPAQFIEEHCRVASRGYMETPSLLGEFLFPKESHRWIILEIDGKLVIYEKDKMPGNYGNNYGELFLNYLPYQSLVYKMLWLTEGDLMINRYGWEGKIDYIVNPTDPYYLDYFTKPWTHEMVKRLYPPRGSRKEIGKMCRALWYIIISKIKVKLNKKYPLSMNDYLKLKGQNQSI